MEKIKYFIQFYIVLPLIVISFVLGAIADWIINGY